MSDIHPKTIVLGIGNPILGDDGVGIHCIRELQKRFENRPGYDWITFDEGALGGFELMDMVVGYERLVLVDAIQTEGGVPGEIYEMEFDELCTTLHASNPHNVDLTTALKVGERYCEDGIPQDVFIFAMEVISVLEFKEEFTEPVEKAFPGLVDKVEGFLVELGDKDRAE